MRVVTTIMEFALRMEDITIKLEAIITNCYLLDYWGSLRIIQSFL